MIFIFYFLCSYFLVLWIVNIPIIYAHTHTYLQLSEIKIKVHITLYYSIFYEKVQINIYKFTLKTNILMYDFKLLTSTLDLIISLNL